MGDRAPGVVVRSPGITGVTFAGVATLARQRYMEITRNTRDVDECARGVRVINNRVAGCRRGADFSPFTILRRSPRSPMECRLRSCE